ncbi:MAG: M13 family metallopeptidase [Bacteroidota bacterium]
MQKSILFIALFATLFACKQNTESKSAAAAKPDILAAHIDSSANPADDFFQYANGGWLKNNPIPASETSWGIGQLVNEEIYLRKRNINEAAAAKNATSGLDQQIGDFWRTAMDSATIEKQGIEPLRELMQKIDGAQNLPDLMKVAAELHRVGVNVFFGEGVTQDAKNSAVMCYQLWQGGIGLPNRDYYFNTDERTVKIRNAYPGYLTTLFTLTGADAASAAKKASGIVALETQLAKSSRKLEALRDPYANYNKMTTAALSKMAPSVDWQSAFTIIGLPKIDTVVVGQPEFYKNLDNVLKTTPLPVLKDYMTFHLVRTFTPFLSTPFVNNGFDFYSKLIRGAQALRPRWKRVLDAEEGAIGEALGQLFAKEYFNETAKKRYENMVENVRTAYKARMEKLPWMTDSTRQKALAKLAAITKKVGYPDHWKDFSALKIDRSSYAANMMRANAWWNQYSINKLGKPVDRTEWDMTPQTYNAYYNPSNNEIVLPAGIFTVPGYFDAELDDALVYGYSAASTIGHEITHGFDDEGRQFDAKGNLFSWWTKDDETQFKKRSDVLVRQFNNMVVVDTAHINGRQTLGENLADLGGILIGLDAFKMTDTYKKGAKISGFTPLQRYFLGYALGWMYNFREASIASQIMTDVHAPAKQRVNGPMPNVPEFYEAFNVKPGNKLFIADSLRVILW